MKNNIGVMQGKLLARYQIHPVGYWQDKFFKQKNWD
jgi:hypothetical protein